MLEEAAAPLFRQMISARELPVRPSAAHGVLAQFISVQHGRTQARETEVNSMADKFAKHVVRRGGKPDLIDALDYLRITIENAPTWNVHNAAVWAPLLFDLERKLIVAPTGSFFIASDNPVVFLNQYIDRAPARVARAFGSTTALGSRGYASRGLQISLPISPEIGLFLYDRDIYKVGPVGRTVISISKEDVDHLNALEYINAHNNIYFADGKHADYVRRIAKLHEHVRQPAFGKFEVTKPEQCGDRRVERIVIGASDPKFVPALGFCKIRRRVDKMPIPGVRDPVMVRIIEDFSDAMKKHGKPMEFGPFLARHPVAGQTRRF